MTTTKAAARLFDEMGHMFRYWSPREMAALRRRVRAIEDEARAPSSETRLLLERLDRGVTRATRHTDGMIEARTVHLFIADLLREGASDD